ncbi:MAG: MarR family winged helix-turn-helix transcriptional regulator [Eubacteriales bacterium]
MLDTNFIDIYTKFKLSFYKKIFVRFETREANLTTVEMFCMEVIYALKKPSIQEFATFIGLSSPNAAYKVQSLIKKGYLNKIQSKRDKREYYLEVTDKFLDYYGITYDYTKEVVKRMQQRFSSEELLQLDYFLGVISEELMTDVSLIGK